MRRGGPEGVALEVLALFHALLVPVLDFLRRQRAGNSANFAQRVCLAATGALRAIAPRAGGMLWLQYDHDIGSTELAQRLMDEEGVLLVPGDQYGMDGWIRVGFGGEIDHVRQGLQRVDRVLQRL